MGHAAFFSGQEQFMAFSFQVKSVLDEILGQLPEPFNMEEMMGKAKEKTPYTVVALQECERMNILTNEIRRSLKELDLGLQVHSRQHFQSSLCPCSALAHRAVPGAAPAFCSLSPRTALGCPTTGCSDTACTFLFLKGRADDYIRDGRAGKCSLL